MNDASQDAGIPVLTQVITPPPKPAQAEPLAGTVAPLPVKPHSASPSGADRIAGSDDARDARRRLEQELTSRILQQMLGRMDSLLEQRLQDSLAEVVQAASANLAEEIRLGLQQTLEHVISEAVAQEMARLRSDKTKHS